MGTSQSSSGPGGGVSLVPPWADQLDDPEPPEVEAPSEGVGTVKPLEFLAPPARFRDTRRALGGFVRSGDTRYLKRTLGHYVRTGYGGSDTMTRRLGSTAVTAGRLNQVLQSGRVSDGDLLRNIALASGNDVNVVLDAIVNAASPENGTQDRESSRRAIRDALSDLLVRFPNADLLAITDAERAYVIERYAALDVYGRFCLDLQKSLMDKAPDTATALRRLRQVREFISQQVSAAFRTVREGGVLATVMNVSKLTTLALHETMRIFEEFTD
ncbi:Qat anti-phage system associated protein QatB [Specibacter sp. AOP5-B1-6]|uniref:Qat anti-phage system associated protein QatB n=1 Tax=Specibacter sp. AOP5-B1-6 TaxID=3457653 RepID=UPI00402B28C4